nr:phospholipase-like protein [Tanacetum cinerariifolium]
MAEASMVVVDGNYGGYTAVTLGRQMLLVGGETENVPLYYHMYDNFQIQFGKEEFCLVTGLKFGVEYSDEYDENDKPIPFRRRVFSSRLDGKRITGKDVKDLIEIKSFKKLDDDDAVSLLLYRHFAVSVIRLIPDEVKAGSGWWLSSKAYFDGFVTEPERRPCHLNRQNHYEVPSELYRDFQEQRSELDQMMKQGQNIFEKINKYMEELNVDTRANREPIITDQYYGISNFFGFESIQTPTSNSIFNMCTPTNWQTSIPLQPGSSNWQSQMLAYTPTPNWQPPISSHLGDAGSCDPSPYTSLPATTELPKKLVGRTKKNSKNDNLSPLNLGNAFVHDNVGGEDVLITGVHDTGIYFTYENVNPYKRQLVPHLCMPRSHSVDNPNNEGWLSRDIEILIRSRAQDADWTVSKSGTACVHPENN